MATLRYDLHLHSTASKDCKTPLEGLVTMARRRGLAGLALTDHDTMDGVKQLLETWPHSEMLLVPGCERTLADGSHLIGLFLKETLKADTPIDVAREIKEQGGLVYVPHPYRAYSGLLGVSSKATESERQWILENCDIIEVFNTRCTGEENVRALELLGPFPRAFAASSDAHWAYEIGTACTEFAAPLSPDVFMSEAAFAPPMKKAEYQAALSRGAAPPARHAAREALQLLGVLDLARRLRNYYRNLAGVKLERYR